MDLWMEIFIPSGCLSFTFLPSTWFLPVSLPKYKLFSSSTFFPLSFTLLSPSLFSLSCVLGRLSTEAWFNPAQTTTALSLESHGPERDYSGE